MKRLSFREMSLEGDCHNFNLCYDEHPVAPSEKSRALNYTNTNIP
jgi:hypothetical protein